MVVLSLGVGAFVLRHLREPQPASEKSSGFDLARLPADTQVIARIDVRKPAVTELWRKFVSRISSSSGSTPSPISPSCASDVLVHVHSLVLSSSQTLDNVRGDYAVLVRGRFRKAALERCADEVSRGKGSRREVDGHTFYPGAADKWLAIISADAVVFGTFDRVKGVVAAFDGRGPVATAEKVSELVEWQNAIRSQPLMLGARLPEGYAAKRFANQSLLATLLDVKSLLVTADIEADALVLRARLNASDANRAEGVRASVANIANMMFRSDAKGEDIAKVRGSNVEARLALTKKQSEFLAARFKL
jgi:hypothetical protein